MIKHITSPSLNPKPRIPQQMLSEEAEKVNTSLKSEMHEMDSPSSHNLMKLLLKGGQGTSQLETADIDEEELTYKQIWRQQISFESESTFNIYSPNITIRSDHDSDFTPEEEPQGVDEFKLDEKIEEELQELKEDFYLSSDEDSEKIDTDRRKLSIGSDHIFQTSSPPKYENAEEIGRPSHLSINISQIDPIHLSQEGSREIGTSNVVLDNTGSHLNSTALPSNTSHIGIMNRNMIFD